PWGWIADQGVVLRDRHGERRAGVPRAARGSGAGVQHRQPALVGHDLRPRPTDQASHRLPGRDRVRSARLRRRRAPHSERREGARAARLGAAGRAGRRPREDDRVVPDEIARIRLARPDTGAEEAARVAEVLESGMLTQGPVVAELEQELASVCETTHAIAVSSGTAALHLAVLALGLDPGDEVIVPAYTFPATANVVTLSGLRPMLVDVDPVTMNLDPERI